MILLVVGVRGCLSSQKKRSLRDYNRDVASLVQESDDQVSKPFFEALSGSGAAAGGEVNLETQVNQLRIVGEDLVQRARKLDVPDEMKPAQSNLLLVLELRRDALRKIAAKLPSAQGRGTASETAVKQITGQMMQFLASDVIYSQRVVPYIKKALDDNEITGQTIATSQFLPSVDWLNEQEVASRLGASVSGGPNRRGPPAPGSHGHGLASVTVAGQELTADEANRIQASPNLTFTVNFENQAENDEQNVVVKISIEGAGRPITAQGTAPQSPAGETTSVDVPLRQAPPAGRPVNIKVTVEPVPGEEDANNNTETYPALFTR